jgi:adenylylsulfate kinase
MSNQNVIPHLHKVSKPDRQEMKGHSSKVIWFTGLSGSGKSTVAGKLEEELFKKGWHTYLLDGDNVRMGLNKGLGFSLEDRTENIRRIGEVSKLFVDAGVVVLSAFVSPLREDRDFVRSLFPNGEFVEVFVECPLEICEQRDVKGLYAKARKGEIQDFTGISSPFEEPLKPEVVIHTATESLSASVEKLVKYLALNNE